MRYVPKRAPSGFMGMRGKKFIDDVKRAPNVGFVGKHIVHIKNILSNLLNIIQFHTGMRGKKENDEYVNQLQYAQSLYGRNDIDDYSDNSAAYDSADMEQRLLNELGLIDDDTPSPDKRAPSAGFFGMRGKKSYDSNGSDNDDNDDSTNGQFLSSSDKRAPSAGFFGMRGKRYNTDSVYNHIHELKRAPMGFQGIHILYGI